MTRLVLPRPDDFHAHLRQGPEGAAWTLRHSGWGRVLAMPNTLPPVASGAAVRAYRGSILRALAPAGPAAFEPLMSFKLLPGMTAAEVADCAAAGAVAGKYYPAGSTTNSGDGPRDPDEVGEALAAMEAAGLVLSVHGEDPGAPVLAREAAFLPVLDRILAARPGLRVVLEHVSTREALEFVLAGPARLGATVTAHHLLLTLDDLMGSGLDPWLHCKPCLREREDRDALREAVFRGEDRIFFGSDSAPHPRAAKEGGRAAAGIWAAPSALPALAGLFEEAGAPGALEPFLCARGAGFYGLPPARGRLVLAREEWTVPAELDGAVPLLAGRVLAWRVLPPD